MKALERQQAIIEALCERRHDTMENLAFEFDCSIRTIAYDITTLSLTYPIYTVCGKHGGGVYVEDGFRLNKRLNADQVALLEKLLKGLTGKDAETMRAILKDFSGARKETR